MRMPSPEGLKLLESERDLGHVEMILRLYPLIETADLIAKINEVRSAMLERFDVYWGKKQAELDYCDDIWPSISRAYRGETTSTSKETASHNWNNGCPKCGSAFLQKDTFTAGANKKVSNLCRACGYREEVE